MRTLDYATSALPERRQLMFWRSAAIVAAFTLLLLAPAEWWVAYARGFQDGHGHDVRAMQAANNALSQVCAREKAMRDEIARLRASQR